MLDRCIFGEEEQFPLPAKLVPARELTDGEELPVELAEPFQMAPPMGSLPNFDWERSSFGGG